MFVGHGLPSSCYHCLILIDGGFFLVIFISIGSLVSLLLWLAFYTWSLGALHLYPFLSMWFFLRRVCVLESLPKNLHIVKNG